MNLQQNIIYYKYVRYIPKLSKMLIRPFSDTSAENLGESNETTSTQSYCYFRLETVFRKCYLKVPILGTDLGGRGIISVHFRQGEENPFQLIWTVALAVKKWNSLAISGMSPMY